jgi:hypothetical protein
MMKRKVAMAGLVMLTGLPHVAVAGAAVKGSLPDGLLVVEEFQSPRYGTEGSVYRLMGRPSIPQALPQRNTVDAWQMEFVAPPSAYRSDDPLTANDKRVGVTFKLDF